MSTEVLLLAVAAGALLGAALTGLVARLVIDHVERVVRRETERETWKAARLFHNRKDGAK